MGSPESLKKDATAFEQFILDSGCHDVDLLNALIQPIKRVAYLVGGMTHLFYLFLKEFLQPLLSFSGFRTDSFVGSRSFPLVFITAASTGMVMTLQFGVGLKIWWNTLCSKNRFFCLFCEKWALFSLLMLREWELAFVSEIGSMVVTQQIDAIRALGTSPIKRIVIPRIIASLISVPLLVAFANMTGVIGGLIVGTNRASSRSSILFTEGLKRLSR